MALLLNRLRGQDGSGQAIRDARRTLSWAELDDRVNRWIHMLSDAGLSTGDHVAVVTGNRIEAYEALLACLHTGVTVVPVNHHLVAAEMAHIFGDAQAGAVLCDEEHAEVVAAALTRCPAIAPIRWVTGSVAREGFQPIEPLLAGAAAQEPDGQLCGAVMLYTSGTTGVPKGVVNGVFRGGEQLAQVGRLLTYAGLVLGVPQSGRALLAGPWYHSAQLYFSLFPLLRGCELVMADRFDPEQTLRTIDTEAVSLCHLVPTQFVRLLRLPESVRAGFSGASLRRVWHGGGPCAPEVKRRMLDWWGPVLVEYYAATEGGVVTLIEAAEWLTKPGSVGRAIPPTRIYIADDQGGRLPAGQIGRVYFERGSAHRFRYHRDQDKTRAAYLGENTYTYGEIGYVDADGFLYLTGRQHHTIVSGGVNVYPAEVEAALLAHKAVRDVAVLGVPDDEFGERVAALVELDGDILSAATAFDELDRHCRARLAGFKVPRVWRAVQRLPRDESGKLRHDAAGRLLTEPARPPAQGSAAIAS